jgi:hypothetical protein
MLPLVLLAVGRIVASPDLPHTALLTIVLVLELLGGHPETNLHVVTIGVAYGIFEMWRQRQFVRPVIAASIAGVLALLICAIALLPFLDALPQTMEYLVRTKMYAQSALPANLWPFMRYRVRGLLPPRADVGGVALVLAAFALFRVRSSVTWFFAALFVFGFLAGHQVWPVAQLLHALPLFDITLNDRLIAAASFGLAMLAALGAEAIAGLPSKAAASRRTPKAAFAWILPLLLAATGRRPRSLATAASCRRCRPPPRTRRSRFMHLWPACASHFASSARTSRSCPTRRPCTDWRMSAATRR